MMEFSLELFPVMIFPPISFKNVQGKIVLNDFVLSSSMRDYSDSIFSIKSPIIATVENSRMVSFEGEPLEIEALKRQFQLATNITGGDAFAINSWHTGINPYTFMRVTLIRIWIYFRLILYRTRPWIGSRPY
jgi:hypothetical protein